MDKRLRINGEDIELSDMAIEASGAIRFTLHGTEYHFAYAHGGSGGFILRGGHAVHRGVIAERDRDGGQRLFLDGTEATVSAPSARRGGSGQDKTRHHRAPMPGTVQKILVKPGDAVTQGEALLVLEAMKLQLTIEAAHDGTVEAVLVKTGELVSEGAELVQVEENAT